MKLNFKLIDGSEKNFTVKEDKFVIGRSQTCQVVIPFDGFSRQHCLIEVDQGEIFITDLNSSNGVFINDHRITAQKRVAYKTCLPLAIGGAFAVQIDLETPAEKTRSLVNLMNFEKLEQQKNQSKTLNESKVENKILKMEDFSKKTSPKKNAVKTDWLKHLREAFILGSVILILYFGYLFKDRIFKPTDQDEELYLLQYEQQMKSKENDGSVKTKDF